MSEGVPRVFLDTEIFVRGNFDYTSPRFDSLRALGAAGTIRVFLTDLTLREIQSNLHALVEASAASVRPSAILRNSKRPRIKALFDGIDVESIRHEFDTQLAEYLSATKATVLRVRPSVLPDVLNAYFEKRAPFGPGKNKAEFPDALVIETLRCWCEEEGQDMAVISSDAGVKAACITDDRLHSFDDLSAYLDALFASEEALSSFVRRAIPALHDSIFEQAKRLFPQHGAILVNQDGEVEEIQLLSVDFGSEEDDLEIINLAPGRADVELAVSMSFSASLTFKKPGTGTWDSEDHILMFQDEVEETVTQDDLEGRIGVEISFQSLERESVKLCRVWFEGYEDIEVYSDYDKDW